MRRIRRHWPRTRLTFRGDSHYGRAEAMTWCEDNGVDYIRSYMTQTSPWTGAGGDCTACKNDPVTVAELGLKVQEKEGFDCE